MFGIGSGKKERVAVLDALEDGRPVRLCFRTEADAQRFKDFSKTYIEESGAGNGYGAYWVYGDTEILTAKKPPSDVATSIGLDLLDSMMYSIVRQRTATDRPTTKVGFDVIIRDGIIEFAPGEIPPRLTPGVGDYFRDPARDESPCREGRVLAIEGDEAIVISGHEEADDGSPWPGATRHRLPLSRIMKVYDYRSAILRRQPAHTT